MEERPSRTRLTDEALGAMLGALSAWSVTDDRTAIVRTYRCRDFRAAVALIDRIADAAEAANHHPDLALRRYRHLEVRLTTHDAGGVTAWDVEMARTIDELATED
jgi:4a-hydroxytetrahydrobiopterin dehydratase